MLNISVQVVELDTRQYGDTTSPPSPELAIISNAVDEHSHITYREKFHLPVGASTTEIVETLNKLLARLPVDFTVEFLKDLAQSDDHRSR